MQYTKVIDGVLHEGVNRTANVGEKILIVNANYTGDAYSNGDVLEVTGTISSHARCRSVECPENPAGQVDFQEYVVLEPLAPLADVPPEAGEMVEHPSHYTSGKFEVIEMIAEVTKGYEDPFVAYDVGNVTKYIARAPHKGKLVEDLKKARQYLTFAIDHLEGEERDG